MLKRTRNVLHYIANRRVLEAKIWIQVKFKLFDHCIEIVADARLDSRILPVNFSNCVDTHMKYQRNEIFLVIIYM